MNATTDMPAAGFVISRAGTALFRAQEDGVAETLLGLLCHGEETSGSVVTCRHLSVPKAALLAAYHPSAVHACTAHPEAVALLQGAGTTVIAGSLSDVVEPDEGDSLGVQRMVAAARSPEEFRDTLRMRMLSALQKRGRLAEDWTSVSPESCLGGGGGGT